MDAMELQLAVLPGPTLIHGTKTTETLTGVNEILNAANMKGFNHTLSILSVVFQFFVQ